jgi:RND family efflux transporter MFP subunit
MNLIRQAVLGLAAIAISLVIWSVYVPSAAPYLERMGVYGLLGIDPPSAEGEDGGRGFGSGAAQVVVAPVAMAQASARVASIGDGRAVRSVTVRSESTGMIAQIAVESGAFVDVGALMVQLEDENERIALERARLTLADAASDLERLNQLNESGSASEVQLREAELAYRSAELEVQQAEIELSHRRILAPISGWIGLLGVSQGDRIGTEDAIAVITDRSSIQIEFRVPERYITDLSVGMPVTVSPLADPDRDIAGEIIALDNVVERASRTLLVQALLPNSDDSLRVGQAFEVTLSFTGDDLPAVDPLAIQWSSDGSFVWVVRDGQAVRVPVVIRQRNSDTVLVEGALVEDDMVVTEGVQSLRPGGNVEVVTAAGATRHDTAQTTTSSDS